MGLTFTLETHPRTTFIVYTALEVTWTRLKKLESFLDLKLEFLLIYCYCE